MEFSEFGSDLYVRVNASKGPESGEICAMLRGLLFDQGQSDGQGRKNNDFRQGCQISFGANFTMRDFVRMVDEHFSRATRAKIEIKEI